MFLAHHISGADYPDKGYPMTITDPAGRMRHHHVNEKAGSPSSAKENLDLSKRLSLCWQMRKDAREKEAIGTCRNILSLYPGSGQAWHLLGLLFMDRGEFQQAVTHLQKAVSVDPEQPLHYNNLGVALTELKRPSKAIICLKKALELSPDYLDAKCNMGLAFYHLNQMDRAADIFGQIISAQPDNACAHANMGLVHMSRHRYAHAALAYRKAIEYKADQSQWHGNLGAAYLGSGEYDQAAECFRNALDLSPNNYRFHVSLGICLRFIGRYDSAIKALKDALSIKPEHPEAIANLIIAYEQTCHWSPLKDLYPILDTATRQALMDGELPHEDPMLNIRRSCDLALNRGVAQAWSQQVRINAMRQAEPFKHGRPLSDKARITVGYLSHDFRDHPVSHQLYPLFRLHDRQRFRILIFSLGPDDNSTYRKEIESNCDDFFDLAKCGLAEASRIIFDQQVDILVDLMGHSKNNRMDILALRPAPIQVSYLGFLSTTGADFIDYIVADRLVVPPEHEGYYSEKIISMPDCYQLNHCMEMDEKSTLHRKDHHLPLKGFVFCCFNVAYKVDQPLFETWMRILKRTPGSVLWLYASNPLAVRHMHQCADENGVDPKRLVFADKMPLDEHLKRLTLADLALDTLRYNGGATTSDALQVGLPVLTVQGRHWVSRMSSSHVFTAGMAEMAVKDLQAYEEMAVDLATNIERLDDLRCKLLKHNREGNLFDSHRFAAALESGFEAVWCRHLNGNLPQSIQISGNFKKVETQPKNHE